RCSLLLRYRHTFWRSFFFLPDNPRNVPSLLNPLITPFTFPRSTRSSRARTNCRTSSLPSLLNRCAACQSFGVTCSRSRISTSSSPKRSAPPRHSHASPPITPTTSSRPPRPPRPRALAVRDGFCRVPSPSPLRRSPGWAACGLGGSAVRWGGGLSVRTLCPGLCLGCGRDKTQHLTPPRPCDSSHPPHHWLP